jgi:hypothetical protein
MVEGLKLVAKTRGVLTPLAAVMPALSPPLPSWTLSPVPAWLAAAPELETKVVAPRRSGTRRRSCWVACGSDALGQSPVGGSRTRPLAKIQLWVVRGVAHAAAVSPAMDAHRIPVHSLSQRQRRPVPLAQTVACQTPKRAARSLEADGEDQRRRL